jgi:hypothetical protein
LLRRLKNALRHAGSIDLVGLVPVAGGEICKNDRGVPNLEILRGVSIGM